MEGAISFPNAGDWPLTGQEVGADLWPLLNRFADGVFTGFAAATRPPDIEDGGLWSREEADGTHTLMLWSNGNDVALLRSTPSGGITGQNIYTKTEVDNLVGQAAAAVAALGEVPVGGIIMWSGAATAIPARYALCDGSGGTPDLTDRFIVGAGGQYNVGATGGQDEITDVPDHDHTFSGRTGNGGNHDHGGETANDGNDWRMDVLKTEGGSDVVRNESGISSGSGSQAPRLEYTAPHVASQRLTHNATHRHDIPSSGPHDHAFSGRTDDTGVAAVDIRPRYYALAFIQRKT